MFNLKNDRLLRAIYRQPLDCTPIWLMRQAGRYLPEYRKTREQAGSFMNLCKTPELAAEVSLQPLKRYDLDAAIIFSDILTIPDAMGLGLHFIEGKGPIFSSPLRHEQEIKHLASLDLASLEYVYTAIRYVNQELAGQLPLIGFCGSPWTLAAYMLEGESKPGFPKIKQMLHDQPDLLHLLLAKLADAVALHLNEQINAGVHTVMIFDTWGGLLTKTEYQEFSARYISHCIAALKRNRQDSSYQTPVILFTKGGSAWLHEMAALGCDVISLDAEIALGVARQQIGEKVALQGNLDPACLLQGTAVIRDGVAQVLASYGAGSGHIFNLGHGITPQVDPAHVTVLVEAVHELSRAYHTVGAC